MASGHCRASNVPTEVIPKYESGHSLLEIARMTGVPRTSLRDILIRAGISLKSACKGNKVQEKRGSGQVRWNSPYGFKYERGRLVPHPQEFETLRLILRWSKEEQSFEDISKKLNAQKLRPSSASLWTRFNVRQIIKWHQENPEVILKRDGNVVTYAPWDPASSSGSKTINEPKSTRRSHNGTR